MIKKRRNRQNKTRDALILKNQLTNSSNNI